MIKSFVIKSFVINLINQILPIKKLTNKNNSIILVTIFVSLIIRIYLSKFDGFKTDINDFKIWSQTVSNVGFSNFYSKTWSDYPPFYIYILAMVGNIYKLFSPSFDITTAFFTIIIKLPANIADILVSLLIFKILNKNENDENNFKVAYFGMVAYAFNPAIIYNSAIWGQVDAVNTLFILLALILMKAKRLELACIFLTIAILTKPQSLVILPVAAILLFKDLLIKNQKPYQKILRFSKIIIITLFSFIFLTLPFFTSLILSPYLLIDKLVKIYTSGYSQYAYNSVNAFNVWALLGFWKDDSNVILSLSYRTWGYILFGILLAYVTIITITIINKKGKNEDKDKFIYLSVAVLFFGFFMFFTRIHERYLFPMFAPLIIATELNKNLRYIFWILTFTFLINLQFVLQNLNNGLSISDNNPIVLIILSVNLITFIYMLYCFSKSSQLK